ncbi:MAG: RNA methyltransferase [Turicibacter sp.]|nr:RNA methyltransferase [Turicibacter sp.]
MLIESNQNAKYKHWMKLKQKKHREKAGEFLVEGEHLVKEAISHGAITEIIVREDAIMDGEFAAAGPIHTIKAGLFDKLASTQSPQPVMAVCKMGLSKIGACNRLLLLDAIQDPGNLGTLIRSAAAFGFDGIILGDGCVDIYNDKAIRATQGAIFKLPMERENLSLAIPRLQQGGVRVLGTSLAQATPLSGVSASGKLAFILGNEGSGVSKELLGLTDGNIFIEMREFVESLNVSIAGSVIMYNFRQ